MGNRFDFKNVYNIIVSIIFEILYSHDGKTLKESGESKKLSDIFVNFTINPATKKESQDKIESIFHNAGIVKIGWALIANSIIFMTIATLFEYFDAEFIRFDNAAFTLYVTTFILSGTPLLLMLFGHFMKNAIRFVTRVAKLNHIIQCILVFVYIIYEAAINKEADGPDIIEIFSSFLLLAYALVSNIYKINMIYKNVTGFDIYDVWFDKIDKWVKRTIDNLFIN
jgi:hypothetical protein